MLIGQDRRRFTRALADHAPDVPVDEIDSTAEGAMDEAVRRAGEHAATGSTVVLAPAAASMDMFTDYAHRGRAFADAVRGVVAEQVPGASGERGG